MRIKMIIDEEQFMIILFCELREKSKQNRMGDFLFLFKQLSIEKKYFIRSYYSTSEVESTKHTNADNQLRF